MFTSISLAYYSTEQAREGSNIEELLEDLEQEDEEGSGFFEDRRPADMVPPSDPPELETPTPSLGADVGGEPAATQGGQSSDGDAPDDNPENSAE